MTIGLVQPYGPFCRSSSEITPTIRLAEVQDGTKGSGKVWRQSILIPDPEVGRPFGPNTARGEWMERAMVKRAVGRRTGQWKCSMWRASTIQYQNNWIEGYFDTEEQAVEFMVRNAPTFFA